MKYDWKLPTVWASQQVTVGIFTFSLSLSLLGSKFFNQEGKHMSAMYQTFQNTPIFQTAWRFSDPNGPTK